MADPRPGKNARYDQEETDRCGQLQIAGFFVKQANAHCNRDRDPHGKGAPWVILQGIYDNHGKAGHRNHNNKQHGKACTEPGNRPHFLFRHFRKRFPFPAHGGKEHDSIVYGPADNSADQEP